MLLSVEKVRTVDLVLFKLSEERLWWNSQGINPPTPPQTLLWQQCLWHPSSHSRFLSRHIPECKGDSHSYTRNRRQKKLAAEFKWELYNVDGSWPSLNGSHCGSLLWNINDPTMKMRNTWKGVFCWYEINLKFTNPGWVSKRLLRGCAEE